MGAPASTIRPLQAIGRYLLFGEIAAGGMATVHLGRMTGVAGFARTVAIKRLHPTFAKDEEFVAMFLDEARLAARIRHPNVISTLDVVATEDEVFLVMEYVQGESLAKLRRATAGQGKPTDARIVASIMSGMLHGLHAAHEATDEQGRSLGIVHRDVSPQNILVGVDGAARLLDFGVAKALGRAQITQDGEVKGKLAYMPPEQLNGGLITRRADIYSAAVVTWEALTGQRLFQGNHQAAVITSVFQKPVPRPSEVAPHVPPAFDRVVMRGLARDPGLRYASAREMAIDLERCAGVASTLEVGAWVESLAGPELRKRRALLSEAENASAPDALEQHWQPRNREVSTLREANMSSPPWSASQVSGSAAIAVRRPSKKLVSPLTLCAAAALLLAGVAVPFSAYHRTHEVARAPHAAALEPAPIPQGDSPLPLVDTGAANAPSDVAAAPPKADPEPSPAPAKADVSSGAPSAVTRFRPKARIAAENDCDPPFAIDGKGHKHYKAACLP